MSADEKQFWTAKQAAAYLMIHVATLYSWCNGKKRGSRPPKLNGAKPPFRRFGRYCMRFPIAEFKEWAHRKDK